MRLDFDDVVADCGLDNLRTTANLKAKRGSFDFGVEQVAAREPTQLAARFRAIFPG